MGDNVKRKFKTYNMEVILIFIALYIILNIIINIIFFFMEEDDNNNDNNDSYKGGDWEQGWPF